MDRIIERIKGNEKIVILGIGNRLKGDDAVGSIIAEKLKEKIKNKNILVIDAENIPENYIEVIKKNKPSLILIIDSVDFNSTPGDFRIFKIDEIKDTTISTHNLSLSLLKILFEDTEIYIMGIQPEKIKIGEEISFNVLKAIDKIISFFDENMQNL
ncbi:MAG: hydrogenase maturation peptidase HycI [Candidatus Omnitrophica bacterium]|nr:hydrogenase maturation peptidase HycI [Candidatus Omnitrophota bacterium]MCM8808723.1 hydrogenase maturation peptidase HycI [Candidatus Omnitrophota bacterium]MCM8810567.1 hydrogenase maturation peptidase HycI [Candidatus Omnitrophota bacterium]MCM8833048.1 hydrogenase maturation peptidase HycI [Candidatus Omnitrophota bacterium]